MSVRLLLLFAWAPCFCTHISLLLTISLGLPSSRLRAQASESFVSQSSERIVRRFAAFSELKLDPGRAQGEDSFVWSTHLSSCHLASICAVNESWKSFTRDSIREKTEDSSGRFRARTEVESCSIGIVGTLTKRYKVPGSEQQKTT